MFTIVWDNPAFDQMNALIHWYPQLRSEFSTALRELQRLWNERGNNWGEARGVDHRLGFEGPLSVLIQIDEEDQVVNVQEVQLRRNALPS